MMYTDLVFRLCWNNRLDNSILKGRVKCWNIYSCIIPPLKNSSNILYDGTHR